MKPHLVIHTDWDQHPLYPDQEEAFRQQGVEVVRLVSRTREEFLETAVTADAILNSDFRLSKDLILALKRCLVISRYGTGVDNIDVEAATLAGIPVANVVGFCTDAVADRTLLLLLAAASKLPFLDRSSRQGIWGTKHLPFTMELKGKTLGLVGFGKIGRAVASRGREFGLRLVAFDPFVSPECMYVHGVEPSSLDALIAGSDFVSFHVPLTSETHHLLDERRLRLMKSTAILINTSRGAVVDEGSLVRVLQEKRIHAAALDVFEQEPPDPDNPLFRLENTVLTPHCAAHTSEAIGRVRRAAVNAVMAVFANEPPSSLVNPEVWKKRRAASTLSGCPASK